MQEYLSTLHSLVSEQSNMGSFGSRYGNSCCNVFAGIIFLSVVKGLLFKVIQVESK